MNFENFRMLCILLCFMQAVLVVLVARTLWLRKAGRMACILVAPLMLIVLITAGFSARFLYCDKPWKFGTDSWLVMGVSGGVAILALGIGFSRDTSLGKASTDCDRETAAQDEEERPI
jgi:uncharacterized membrane protein